MFNNTINLSLLIITYTDTVSCTSLFTTKLCYCFQTMESNYGMV